MACDDRQLTQAQLEAGFAQQRTGVVQALRPFSGPPTLANLVDYVNRELGPAVRNSRAKVNDCFQQVTDNAPSANPLGYYFSTNTANADPTAGRVRLDAATQNTATTLRVSESNARLQDVSAWLDMMIGGSTLPLGVVTLMDAINPGRFLRGNLTNITPQVGYRDLAITVFEASHPDPFVDSEAVLVSYIAGMADGGVTVPVSVLAPIARDTFLGNIGTTTVAPSAVPLADVDSASVIYDATSHTFQRAALTGFTTAAANSNATSSAAPIVTYSTSSDMSAERVVTSSTSVTVDIGTAGQVLHKRAALTGEVTAAADSNACTVTRSTDFSATPWTGPHKFNGATLQTLASCATTFNGNIDVNAALFTTIASCASTFNGTVDANNVASLNGPICATARITPSALASDQNDYTPTSWADASWVRLSTSGGVGRAITGAAAGRTGELKWLVNLGPDVVTLKHENASSSAASRFLLSTGTNFDIVTNGVAGIWYDGDSTRWRLINA